MLLNYLDWICLEELLIQTLYYEKLHFLPMKIELVKLNRVLLLKQIWKEIRIKNQNQLNFIMNFSEEKRQFMFLI
jgi:hypothetical protein